MLPSGINACADKLCYIIHHVKSLSRSRNESIMIYIALTLHSLEISSNLINAISFS